MCVAFWVSDKIRADNDLKEFYRSSFEFRREIVWLKNFDDGLKEVQIHSSDSNMVFSNISFHFLDLKVGDHLKKDSNSLILKVKRNGRVEEHVYQR
ncbi:hypothetical protein BFP97_19890 [Roseivirga sp. 4D4]|nr:hypothetical protein BFP97_19890 [Roseivirga sp. 4D4]